MNNTLPLSARIILIALGISSLLCASTAMAVLPIAFIPVTLFGVLAGIFLMAVGLKGLSN